MNNPNSNSSITSSLNQLKISSLPQLKLSHTVKTSILSAQIVEFIVNEVKLIPHYETLSQDLHLMNHIANLIENLERRDLDPKLDKKTLFLDIIKQLFPNLNTDQLSFLDNFADFIVSHNLVSKVTTLSKFVSSVKKNLSSN
jgi:hypothetical protein